MHTGHYCRIIPGKHPPVGAVYVKSVDVCVLRRWIVNSSTIHYSNACSAEMNYFSATNTIHSDDFYDNTGYDSDQSLYSDDSFTATMFLTVNAIHGDNFYDNTCYDSDQSQNSDDCHSQCFDSNDFLTVLRFFTLTNLFFSV